MSFAPALSASPARAALRAWICLALAACLLSPSAFAAKPKKNKTAASKNAVAAKSYRNDLRVREAARQIAERQGLSAAWVRATLAQAQKLPEVIRAASPVADPGVRNWDAYRRRVLDPVRIQAGVRFWQANATTLARAQQQSGVDAGTIVGILGAETLYGQRMGKYRVLDALATLAFDFPTQHPKAAGRSAYFLQELEAFLLWSHQTGRDPLTVRGSYAG
ncbi:MAG: lytic murein transglycosylase, partial [Betaproteobacteria bacterium]